MLLVPASVQLVHSLESHKNIEYSEGVDSSVIENAENCSLCDYLINLNANLAHPIEFQLAKLQPVEELPLVYTSYVYQTTLELSLRGPPQL